jgi:hypothetical protein
MGAATAGELVPQNRTALGLRHRLCTQPSLGYMAHEESVLSAQAPGFQHHPRSQRRYRVYDGQPAATLYVWAAEIEWRRAAQANGLRVRDLLRVCS